MKIFLLIFLLAMGSVLTAQTDTSYITTEVENQIYSMDFFSAKIKVFDLIRKKNFQIQNQNESQSTLKFTFQLNPEQYKSYDSLIAGLGYSTLKKVNAISNYSRVYEINLELSYLKQKKDSYLDLINKLEEKSNNYLTLWNEQKMIEEKIFIKEQELINLNKKENTYSVSLDLNDEITSPENTEVSFVNMPGVEYSFLMIESPKSGLSAKNYQGYFLKYLLTKGKSFASIGVYKSNKLNKSDSTGYLEMFVLGIGQDFYSRHLGRGSRRFFNLYSGYSVGGILATGKTNKSNMFYISPSIGLELFKNKYFLIDTKAYYFVPLTNTRYLRGLSYNASFNFVF